MDGAWGRLCLSDYSGCWVHVNILKRNGGDDGSGVWPSCMDQKIVVVGCTVVVDGGGVG